MLLHICDIPKAQTILDTGDFGTLEAENHDVYSVAVSKNRVHTCFVPQAEQQHWYLRSF